MDSGCEDAYLAGVFDGEGYVGVGVSGGTKYGLTMQVSMVNKYVVLRFQKRFGGSVNRRKAGVDKRTGNRQRDTWVWRMTGSKIIFLRAIQEHLTEKRTQINLALQYIGEFGEGQCGNCPRTVEYMARKQWYLEEFKRLKKANGVEAVAV